MCVSSVDIGWAVGRLAGRWLDESFFSLTRSSVLLSILMYDFTSAGLGE